MASGIPVGLTGVALFNVLQKDGDKLFEQYKNSKFVQRDIDYFRKNIGKVESAEDLVKDQKLIRFTLVAFGLEAELQNLGRIRKVLEEPLTNERALANRLVDPRFKELAKFFSFGELGATKIKLGATQSDLIGKFLNQGFETEIGNADPAVREARYFLRNAPKADGAFGLLSDNVIRSVITSTFDVPPTYVNQSLLSQKGLFERLVDVDKLTQAAAEAGATGANKTVTQIRAADLQRVQEERSKLAASSSVAEKLYEDIQNLTFAFGSHAILTDPVNGPYVNEVDEQQAAFKTLVEQQQLISAATDSLSQLRGKLDELRSILDESQDPEVSDFSDIQARFAALAAEVKPLVAGPAAPGDPETRIDVTIGGVRQNLLDGTVGTLTAITTDAGQSVTISGQDLANTEGGAGEFLFELNQAATAVASASSAGDFAAAFTALASSRSAFDTVDVAVKQDASELAAAIDAVPEWVLPESDVNTTALKQGRTDVTDALTATTEISQLVASIRQQATDIQFIEDATDRRTAYDNLRADIVRASNLASGSTLLSGVDASYNINNNPGDDIEVTGQDIANDLANYVANLPDPADPATPTNDDFNQLIARIDDEFNPRFTAAVSEFKAANQALSLAYDTIDPIGSVYAQYGTLEEAIREIADPEDPADGDALLSRYGASSSFVLESSGRTVSVNAYTDGVGFSEYSGLVPGYAGAQSVLQTVVDGLALIPGDKAGALAALDQALFDVQQIVDDLRRQDLSLAQEEVLLSTDTTVKTSKDDPLEGVELEPIPENDYARRLIESFLVRNAASPLLGGSQAGLLGLFQTPTSASQLGSFLNLDT